MLLKKNVTESQITENSKRQEAVEGYDYQHLDKILHIKEQNTKKYITKYNIENINWHDI